MKIFILLLMVFLHIIDDYKLQGILASMKQKKYWKENAPDILYEHDYIMALATHAFSWAFMIMLPVAWTLHFNLTFGFVIIFIINWVLHAIVDDLKCNKFKINLIEDQLIHLIQIIGTFLLLVA